MHASVRVSKTHTRNKRYFYVGKEHVSRHHGPAMRDSGSLSGMKLISWEKSCCTEKG